MLIPAGRPDNTESPKCGECGAPKRMKHPTASQLLSLGWQSKWVCSVDPKHGDNLSLFARTDPHLPESSGTTATSND